MSSPFSVIAIILGGLSFLLFPILFGPAAIILAPDGFRTVCRVIAELLYRASSLS